MVTRPGGRSVTCLRPYRVIASSRELVGPKIERLPKSQICRVWCLRFSAFQGRGRCHALRRPSEPLEAAAHRASRKPIHAAVSGPPAWRRDSVCVARQRSAALPQIRTPPIRGGGTFARRARCSQILGSRHTSPPSGRRLALTGIRRLYLARCNPSSGRTHRGSKLHTAVCTGR
jgi:hypothetical protein